MSTLIQRARHLRERNRHPEAIAALHQHLAGDPDDFRGHFELAVTRLSEGEDHRAALHDAERAIAIEPEAADAHAIRSAILNRLERHQDALASADEARRLEPESSFAWFCRGNALLGMRKLAEAEEAARRSLAHDPDDSAASNLLATVLRLQSRFHEAEVEIERHLARDPENAWTFATSGWTALHQGQRKKAEELFREALRLDATLEHARVGLRESYKARSFPYRLYLRWVFFLQKYSEKNQWGIFIGIYLAYRFGRAALAAIHPIAAVPLIVAYLLFCFGGWLANGLGNFLMLTDPLARLTLNAEEKREGWLVGGLFFFGLLTLTAGATVLPIAFAFLGGALMGAAIPGSMVFDNPSVKGRIVFGLITATVLVCGMLVFVSTLGKSVSDKLLDPQAGPPFMIGVLAITGTTWLGGISSLRNAALK
jgi:tetratricopeptide (TPR) repeat protein